MTHPAPPIRRRGQAIRGSATDWSRRRLAANLSLTELAEKTGISRTNLGYIDQGRMVPTDLEVVRLNAALPETGVPA